ncbi:MULTISPECIES: STAS domain-containing protein [unclassified Siphonobacter]|uniref:STAS domain-containing protein n=1 Tax=unclassified Siphonobacter TaxID=2635712 RepID=UPI00278700DE|nr:MULTISPECIES: STAS domain-containing protein [unclassified Siphonobacter]MDQ1088551.1 anti-anti-sigma regulatory factor [Siphonobacter sp. SORGH_AS_1065]MDR6194697.1 anti-anti-sigma regulatory factor [Siphonobacter sp. SORGH_AS_0500]
MDLKIEKNQQYVLIDIPQATIDTEASQALSKSVASLWKEGYTNMVIDLAQVQNIEQDGFSVLRKANELCLRDGGLFVLVTKDDELTEELDGAKIRDLTILPTVEEAVDAVFMNELEGEFREEEDDEYDYGGSADEEGSSSSKDEEY